MSVVDVKMEIEVLVGSLKSNIFSFSFDVTFLGVVNAALEQYRCKANKVTQGDWKFDLEADPNIPSNPAPTPQKKEKKRNRVCFYPIIFHF